MPKVIHVGILCFCVKLMKNEAWLLNYEWIHDYLLLMFWNMLLMNWYNGYPYLWIGDENCGCCRKFV